MIEKIYPNNLLDEDRTKFIHDHYEVERFAADITGRYIGKDFPNKRFGLHLSILPDALMHRSMLIEIENLEDFLDEMGVPSADYLLGKKVVAHMVPWSTEVVGLSAYDPNDKSVRDERLATKVREMHEFLKRSA